MAKLDPQLRYSRGGKTLLHEIRINPTHKQIDAFYRQFRVDLRQALSYGDVEKLGTRYHLAGNNQAACAIYLPMRRWFTLQDVTESKRVFKKYRDYIARHAANKRVNMDPDHFVHYQSNWNDIQRFQVILKRLRIKKPVLMAHLIFAAWKHDNINLLKWTEDDGNGRRKNNRDKRRTRNK